MNSETCYKSKLRSFSDLSTNDEMKYFAKMPPTKKFKIDAEFTTPMSQELKSKQAISTPGAPRANRSILEASMVMDSPSASQISDKTPKRKSERKSRLSEGQPNKIVATKRSSRSTQTNIEEKTKIGKLVAENRALKNTIAQKEEEIAKIKRRSQNFVENLRSMTEKISFEDI